ncbi:hypothetical protein CANCADRAFT_748 [Tortispora caseinolytica NRRL Y-17796]|uniref:Chromatin remodelling complex ATPase chain ISW1 n=1 Tax=Tortispora caseinolytica NRRL Y-17796 TaxID=767744 RepID=A0A1E4TK67_9ASCO|nr:hypothetical protein CANCADRAFT_748 [Tortispora caseinolytica NRRL Y-17796]
MTETFPGTTNATPLDSRASTPAAALQVANLADSQLKLKEKKTSDTMKRLKYLIGQTDLFRHFMDAKAQKDPEFRRLLEEIDDEHKNNGSKSAGDRRHRKTEKEEDAELLQEEEQEDQPKFTVFTESPSYINGKMRDYQVQGLNWLVSLHENGIAGILADEMGLGKTLQTISFIGYLRYICDIPGPHLVAVPKSTLDNWAREFAKWTPEINILVLQGGKEDRHQLMQERLIPGDFDICITSYEMILREKAALRKFAWEYIIIDEAHRIKNEDSMLSQVTRLFDSRQRLLITGTPLQNNLHELWALLNFILPDVFSDSEDFDTWFSSQGNDDQDAIVQQLRRVLQPFLLRRVKSEVEKSLLPKKEVNLYIGMSEMQIKWYQRILEKDIDAVNGAVGKRESKTRLLNIVMQLRKCCNHPYLFEGAEPGPPYTTDEHLIYNAGKMIILDKLLKRLKAQGSRVLIFSQMSRLLDILEDYCLFREYEYCRIDGSTAHEDRVAAIDEYNKPGSDKFVFLLTTRAGGLGINLTTADTVILYDSDWNPQADLQAMDRAHRIGQTKQVVVYRFVTENAIEEKVLERAAQKLRLDQLVIQQGKAQQQAKTAASKDELLGMIQHGAQAVFETKSASMQDDDIDSILAKGEERTKELNAKYAELGLDDLQNFSNDSAYQWNGENFKKKASGQNTFNWINPSKRERKEQTYSIDGYYKEVMAAGQRGPSTHKPRGPKQVHIQDHQFYPLRLAELQSRELAYFRQQQKYVVPLEDGPEDTLEARKADQELEQQEINEAVPLTEKEEAEKARLAEKGFSNWNRREFQHLIHLFAKYGKHNYSAIASEFETKTEEEIKEYAEVFWKRYKEIDGYDRYIAQIEAGEERARKISHQQDLLKKKIEQYRAPLQQMKIYYPIGNSRRTYTEEEDRFLLVELNKYGLDTPHLYDRIRQDIRNSPLFRFDWFFLSRTTMELSRRCNTLLTLVVKEVEGATNGSKRSTEDLDDADSDASSSPPASKAKKRKSNGTTTKSRKK